PKRVSLNSRVLKFNEDFYREDNKFMCKFCHHSVNYKQLTFTTILQAAESQKI
ncbi:14397_t:CDS:2, partial [Racocetra persica]